MLMYFPPLGRLSQQNNTVTLTISICECEGDKAMIIGDGRRVLVLNLVLAVLSLFVSFYVTQEYLRVEQIRIFGQELNRLSTAARRLGMVVVGLPTPFDHVTSVVAVPTGVSDVGHKTMRFFTRNFGPSAMQQKRDEISGSPPTTESIIEGSLLAYLFSAVHGSKRAITNVLHLCSATCCVGPYFTMFHAERKLLHKKDHNLSVGVLIYGDSFAGSVVEGDLAALGVMIPQYRGGRMSTDCMPLHGVVNMEHRHDSVGVVGLHAENTCEYVSTEGPHAPQALANVVPLKEVVIGINRLSAIFFDVVHIDTNTEGFLAAVTYLQGLLGNVTRPDNIILVVYPSVFLDNAVAAVNALRANASYHVLVQGGQCLSVANSTTVSSAEMLHDLLHFADVNVRSRADIRSYAANPLCVLLLSKTFTSVSQLMERMPHVSPEAAMEEFFGTETAAVGYSISSVWRHGGVGPAARALLMILSVMVTLMLACTILRGGFLTFAPRRCRRL